LLETYRSYISSEPFSAAKIYLQIKFCPLGSEYSRESFLRTPVKELSFILSSWHDEQKQRANTQSITTAKLAQLVLQVAHSMGGSKEVVTTKVSDFLPFEFDKEASEQESRTKQVLSKIIKSGRIPAHVVAALSPLISPG